MAEAAQDEGGGPARVRADFTAVARGIGTVKRLAPGDVVFRAGDLPDFMYVVLTGSVEIRGRTRAIERIGPGRALGVVSLVDGKPRSATAVAAEESELACITPRRFRVMVEETPNFLWYVMGELVDRLRATGAATEGAGVQA